MRIAHLASITSSVVLPLALPVGQAAGQARSAPVAISLTAVVLPRVTLGGVGAAPGAPPGAAAGAPGGAPGGGGPIVPLWTDGVVEVTRQVGFANARAARVDVELATRAGVPAGIRAWARGVGGAFVPLLPGARVTVARAPDPGASAPGLVTFRLQLDDPGAAGPARPVELPVSYRLTLGEGETARRWEVSEVLRVEGPPPR